MLASLSALEWVGPHPFPPELVVEVKAIACELPARLGLPFSRLHAPDIRGEVLARGLVASISDTTIWRWLSEDALRPWAHRSWIFPRDPEFERKAGRVLDLYARQWEGLPLGERDFVLCADEKTSIQARIRCHPRLHPVRDRPCASSTNTNEAVPSLTSPPGTRVGRWSSDAANRPRGASRFRDSSTR